MSSVLRKHADAAGDANGFGRRQQRVLRDLIRCRTAELGGHLELCPGCAYQRPSYNSCRNRHCSQCQEGRRRDWAESRAEKTLPVPLFQVVFTLPSELRELARRHPRAVYDAIFEAGSHVLQRLAAQRMDAQLAITAALHTWTRSMSFHPHVHFLVSAGGLSRDGERWVKSRPKFLFPAGVMRAMFRGRMLATLGAAVQKGRMRGERIPQRLLRQKPWVVHVTAPEDRPPEHAIRYLARYVYGVAISDHRLVAADASTVTIRTRGTETVTLPGTEFVRRYLLHVLPNGFRKVRHYGLSAPSMAARLARARELLGGAAPIEVPEVEEPEKAEPYELPICPKCSACRLEAHPLPWAPPARAPPWW